MLLNFFRATLCLPLLLCLSCFATESSTLPLGVVLDDKGQPLSIPQSNNAALNYTPVTTTSHTKSSNKASEKPKSKSKKTSRKQQLASRKSVANDAGCRWLNNRMKLLEKQLSPGLNHRNQHQKQELEIRQDEWECLKCGVEGPNPSDHHSCQYRR